MEEKKEKSVSLVTFVLIILIIALAVMGAFLYKINNEKIVEAQKTAILEAKVNDLNKTVSDLQEVINNTKKEEATTSSENKMTEESVTSDSNVTQDKETEESNKIIKTASPSGFAGSSLNKIVLFSSGDAYWVSYDGGGYGEKNIIKKTLIAKNVEDIKFVEASGNTEGYVMVKGKSLKEIKDVDWVKFQKE